MTDTHDNNNSTLHASPQRSPQSQLHLALARGAARPSREGLHWTDDETGDLLDAIRLRGYGTRKRWKVIAADLGNERSPTACKSRYVKFQSLYTERERERFMENYYDRRGEQGFGPPPPRRPLHHYLPWSRSDQATLLLAMDDLDYSTPVVERRMSADRWRLVAEHLGYHRSPMAYRAYYNRWLRTMPLLFRETTIRWYLNIAWPYAQPPLEDNTSEHNFVVDRERLEVNEETADENMQCPVCMHMCTNVRFACGHAICADCCDRLPMKCTEGQWHKTCHLCRAPVFEKELAYSAPAK